MECHKKASKRGSWAEHAVNGWYIGTSSEHYCAFNIYVKHTRAKQVADTVLFKHKYITWPAITHGNVVVKAALDLARALRGKTVVKSKEQMRDLTQLSEIFGQLAKADPDAANKQVATNLSPCHLPS